MPSDPPEFLRACTTKGILIDSNLLILLAVGGRDPSYIPSHPKTSSYTKDEYDFLVRLIKLCNQRIFVTPYLLAEVSNHTIDDDRQGNNPYYAIARKIVESAEEAYHHKDNILSLPELRYLGFSDVSILRAVEDIECAVITNDGKLYSKLLEKGCNAVHLQTFCAYGQSYVK